MSSLGEMYELSKVFDWEALVECVFIMNIYIRVYSFQSFLFSQYFNQHFHIFFKS